MAPEMPSVDHSFNFEKQDKVNTVNKQDMRQLQNYFGAIRTGREDNHGWVADLQEHTLDKLVSNYKKETEFDDILPRKKVVPTTGNDSFGAAIVGSSINKWLIKR